MGRFKDSAKENESPIPIMILIKRRPSLTNLFAQNL